MVLEPRLLEKHNATRYIRGKKFQNSKKFRIILDSFQLIMTANHCRHYDFRVRKVVKSQYGATTKKGEEMRVIFYISI
jgi:hypothetical protein